jgi:ATP-binding cassette subfamily B protein IrtA
VIWAWVLLGAAGACGRLALLFAANLVLHYADADFQRQLRARLARHMATVPLGWFTGQGAGALKKALDDDIEDLHHLVGHATNDVMSAVGMPVAALVYLLAVDWRMTLVTVAILPVALALIRLAHRSLPERMAQLSSAEQRINSVTIEYVDGIQVTKAFG